MDKRTALRAVTGGAAGTVAMVLALVTLDVQTRSAMDIYGLVARFVGVPGRTTLGFAIFVVVGVVVWPLVFAWAEPHLPPEDDPAVSGMLFATAIWAAFVATTFPEIPAILLFIYGGYTLLAHLAYGFTLGFVYGLTGGTADADADPETGTETR